MTKYIAKLNGQVVGKRTTKSRTYTHAIIVSDPTPQNYYYGKGVRDAAHVAQWCGRPDLATKAAEQARKFYQAVTIVEAEQT